MALELTEDERALLADPSAEAELARAYDRLQQGAKLGLAKVLGGGNVEEDDVQDAVVKALAQWLGKPLEQRQEALAFHIAMRRGQDLGGHIMRGRPAVASNEGNPAPAPGDDFGLDPLDAVLRQELLDDALACLETITGNQRAYVVDVIMSGQSESDWADERDIRQQAANRTKLRAIRRLRDCVKARSEGNNGEDG